MKHHGCYNVFRCAEVFNMLLKCIEQSVNQLIVKSMKFFKPIYIQCFVYIYHFFIFYISIFFFVVKFFIFILHQII